MTERDGARCVETALGVVEYRDEGEGPCLLFVHGSPGGSDQGSLMTRFLRDRGWRTVALSRPGYLVEAIWADDGRRAFALDLMATIVGDRKDGFENDLEQFHALHLGLDSVTAPALLFHARTDADVPYAQSGHAREHLPHADLVTIEHGTHLSVWTDHDADDHQRRISDFLVRP